MKHGKKPTRQQKKLISAWGLNPDNWFVVKDTPYEMTIVHKDQDSNVRVIRKDVDDD